MSNVDQSHDDIAKSRERPVDAPSLLEKGGKEGGRKGGREGGREEGGRKAREERGWSK